MTGTEITGTEDPDTDFTTRYTTLMFSVWNDPQAEQALLADPLAQARAVGLPVRDGATVVLDRSQPDGLFTKQQLLDDWHAAPDRHVLHVPAAPLVDMDELDDRELELLAAGSDSSINVVIVLCIVAA
jgi:hypothetical protein